MLYWCICRGWVKLSKKYQGDKDAPAWPFRIVIAGASNSGKTNMNLNLLTMPKFYYMFKKKKCSRDRGT